MQVAQYKLNLLFFSLPNDYVSSQEIYISVSLTFEKMIAFNQKSNFLMGKNFYLLKKNNNMKAACHIYSFAVCNFFSPSIDVQTNADCFQCLSNRSADRLIVLV